MLMLVKIMMDKTCSKGNIFNDDPEMRFRKKIKVVWFYFKWLWMNEIEPKIVQLCCVGGSSITVVLLETGHGGVILVTGLGLESCEHKAFFVLVDMLSLAVEKKSTLCLLCIVFCTYGHCFRQMLKMQHSPNRFLNDYFA